MGEKSPQLLVILHSEFLGCAVPTAASLHRLLIHPRDALLGAAGTAGYLAYLEEEYNINVSFHGSILDTSILSGNLKLYKLRTT